MPDSAGGSSVKRIILIVQADVDPALDINWAETTKTVLNIETDLRVQQVDQAEGA